MLELRLLGAPTAILNDSTVEGFVSGKAQALLYYIAHTGQVHRRDALAAFLWRDTIDSKAKSNLRSILPNLRNLVGAYLTVTRKTVAFNADSPHRLDAALFVSLMESGISTDRIDLIQRAVDLYADDFLVGFNVRNAPMFEQWALTEREHLRNLVIYGLDRLVALRIARGDYEAALAAARRLRSLDPWRESTQHQVMSFLAQQGERIAALSEFSTYSQRLADDLGVEPSPELAALAAQIENGTFASSLGVSDTVARDRAISYAQLAGSYLARWSSGRHIDVLRDFRTEFENIRQAWYWAVDHQNMEILCALSTSVDACCRDANLTAEAHALYEYAIERMGLMMPGSLIASMTMGRAQFAMMIGRHDQALADLNLSLSLPGIEASPARIRGLLDLSYIFIQRNQFGDAKRCLTSCMESGRYLYPLAEAMAYRRLGIVSWGEGDVYQSVHHTRHAQGLYEQSGDAVGADACRNNLANFLTGCGAFDEAEAYLSAPDASDLSSIFNLWFRAQLRYLQRDYAGACRHAQTVLDALADNPGMFIIAHVLNWLGHGRCGLGEYEAAREAYSQSLALPDTGPQAARKIESTAGLADCCLHLDDLPGAMRHVEEILPRLPDNDLDGADHRYHIYLVCVQVLEAANDDRAAQVLATAQRHLRAAAERIPDRNIRLSYLEAIPAHASLLAHGQP